jgi:hypothetical protein
MLQILSANRLTDGRIVFRDASGAWGSDLAAAARFDSKEAVAAGLEAAKADMAANLVIEVEAIEVKDGPRGLEPITMRDRIRVAGPSVLEKAAPIPAPIKSEQNDVSI